MADTSTQVRVEEWVRKQWMPDALGSHFKRERVELDAGGFFDFDAVSFDEKTIACISTSSALTASGNYASGKMMKIRSDVLFLMMTSAERRILVFTERDMFDACLKEKASGRLPKEIEILRAEIPEELGAQLAEARSRASKEVTPAGHKS